MTAQDRPPAPRYDLDAFRAAIGGCPCSTDPALVRQKSRDFFWFSPVIKARLQKKRADILVRPRHLDDVLAVAAACARLRIPLVVRGAGTGTYGQGVPLEGGVVMEMTALDRLLAVGDGAIRAEVGIRMTDAEEAARATGQELRMHPSTKRSATLGGYFAGGSGGIGSVAWGGLREPGNLLAAKVVSVEETPRIVDLEGADTGLVNRTFGSTGILVEIAMALAPARPWRDWVVAFDGFPEALRFGEALAGDPAIAKKLVSPLAPECAAYLTPLGAAIPAGAAVVLTMVDARDVDAAQALVAAHGGRITRDADSLAEDRDPEGRPIYEFAWGHTTLNALKHDKTITYLQALFPPGRVFETAELVWREYGDEMPMHLEFIRYDGRLAANGAQLVRFTTAERLDEMMAFHEANGIPIANPHVFTVEDGSRHKRVPGDQLAFKGRMDPYGLLNPGKMRTYAPVA